jgi:hypothetical protein
MVPLNEYEAKVADEIAAWKSERPSLVMVAFRGLSRPLSRLCSRFIPDDAMRALVTKAEAMSKHFGGQDEIARKAGVRDLRELKAWPLEECDRLAATTSAPAERQAMVEGAVAGLGGLVTETLNVPILLAASLRSIYRVGHCYGYPLDSEIDRLFVLGNLELATADDPVRRQALDGQLRDLDPDAAKSQAGKTMNLKGVEDDLLEDLAFGAVPIVGDLTSILMDYDFVHRVDITARRVFQERWLRDRGKVTVIFPASESRRRSSLEGGIDVVAQLCYAACYSLAFGVTLPLALLTRAASSSENPAALGARRGAADAARDADRFLAQLHTSAESRSAESSGSAGEPPGLSAIPAA